MGNALEDLIKLVYCEWKIQECKKNKNQYPHLDEEVLAVFSEGVLSIEDLKIILHLTSCDNCSEAVATRLMCETEILEKTPIELIKLAKAMPAKKSFHKISLGFLRFFGWTSKEIALPIFYT